VLVVALSCGQLVEVVAVGVVRAAVGVDVTVVFVLVLPCEPAAAYETPPTTPRIPAARMSGAISRLIMICVPFVLLLRCIDQYLSQLHIQRTRAT
jgi:hypothetical protein